MAQQVNQASLTAAAAIAGGAALLGGLLNSRSQRKTNETNIELAEQQNQWNLEQWNREAAFTQEMYEKTNDYNSPANQRKRYEEAGLNPYLMLDNIESGMATSSPSPSGNTAQSAQVQPLNYDYVGRGVTDAVTVANAFAQQEKTKAETSLLQTQSQYESARLLAEINELRQRGNLSNWQANKLQQEYDFFNEFKNENARTITLQNQYTSERIKESQINQDAISIQNDINRLNLKWLPKEKEQALSIALARARSDIAVNKSVIDLNKKQQEKVFADTCKSYLEAYGVHLNNNQLEELTDLIWLQNYWSVEQQEKDYENWIKNYVGGIFGGSIGVTRTIK